MDEQQQQHQQDLDVNHGDNKSNDQNIVNSEPSDHDLDLDLEEYENNNNGENISNYEPGPLYCTDNNPPESYAVCQSKVSDWLNNHNTFIERKASVKFAISKNLNPCQTRPSRRSVSLNQKPKLSIIGFRKKQVHQTETKSKNNDKPDNVKLFRNRSERGRDYCLLITEPVSPRVSCVGRVGSVRVPGRKAGVWRSFKAAVSNLVQTSRVTKVAT